MKFAHSLKYALAGVRAGLSETNMQIHWAITLVVLALGVFLGLTWLEWAVITLCIGSVVAAELFNTAIEELGDISTENSPKLYARMGKPKDVAAAAVLTLAVMSAVIGCLIFIPRILFLLSHN